MTIEEARTMLSEYADGILEPGPSRELEGLLAQTPALQAELKQLKEENALLEEALAPLRPSKSARMRLGDAMLEVRRKATDVAEALPERGWRIFRQFFCLLALGGATWLAEYRPPTPDTYTNSGLFLVALVFLFMVGLTFVLAGGILARAETIVMNALTRRNAKPSALGILTVQVFGACAVLTALGMYWWMV